MLFLKWDLSLVWGSLRRLVWPIRILWDASLSASLGLQAYSTLPVCLFCCYCGLTWVLVIKSRCLCSKLFPDGVIFLTLVLFCCGISPSCVGQSPFQIPTRFALLLFCVLMCVKECIVCILGRIANVQSSFKWNEWAPSVLGPSFLYFIFLRLCLAA